MTSKIGSGATPLGGEAAYKKEGISLIRSLNVHDWGFRTKDLAFIDDKQAEKLDNVVVESGDVLLNITGASVARCCVVPDEMLPARVNQHVSILRLNKDQLLPKLLHYMLVSKDYKNRLLHAGEDGGSTRQALTKSQLQDFWIEYPDSLPEQQRIVGILDEAFAGIAAAKQNAEKNLQNARALFESNLQAVFTQRGDGWVEKQVGDLCVIGDGNHSSNYPKKDELVAEGVPFIRATNLVAGRISGTDMRFLSPEKHAQLKKGHLKTGDVLFTNRGEIGKTAIVDSAYDNSNLNSQIAWLRCRGEIDNRFLFHLLTSSEMKAHFQEAQSGAALQQYTIRQLRELKVPLPPEHVQTEIAERFDRLQEETQRLASLYQRKLAALDELKKSLLAQAFAGELTA